MSHAPESWTVARAKLAIFKRWHPDADDSDLRERLAAARMDDEITRAVESWPPLTAEQRQRIALLLRGDSDDG